MRLARSLDPDPGTHIKTHATQGESNPNCASWRRPAGRLRWCECTSVCVSRFGVSTPGNDRVLHSKIRVRVRVVGVEGCEGTSYFTWPYRSGTYGQGQGQGQGHGDGGM